MKNNNGALLNRLQQSLFFTSFVFQEWAAHMIRPSRSSVGLFTLHRSSTIVPPPSRKSPAVLHPPPLHPVAPTIPTREHTNAAFYVRASVESPWKFFHFSDRL